MKRTLTILALTLTNSIANINTSSLPNDSKHINIETKSEIITREVRTVRSVPQNREVRQVRNIEMPMLRLTRATRAIPENRYIAQITRESRAIRLVQDKLHFANLK